MSSHESGRLSGRLCGRESGHDSGHAQDCVSSRVFSHGSFPRSSFPKTRTRLPSTVSRKPSAVLPACKPMFAATIRGFQ
ncbi:MAG: hypothetical protein NTX53_16020 [candidate division WOR-3 bacterium]|nr:hypothetical protein [candidate division WOR-3 bacterium]